MPEDKRFGEIYLFRGDTMELARARIRSHVDELEGYLRGIERPAVPPGARPNKRTEAILRNVVWYFRRVVDAESILSLARDAFGPVEHDALTAEAIAFDRRKDVRDGIRSARRLLEAQPYGQPILTLDEYERGRKHL